jgi:hypothetical protein
VGTSKIILDFYPTHDVHLSNTLEVMVPVMSDSTYIDDWTYIDENFRTQLN